MKNPFCLSLLFLISAWSVAQQSDEPIARKNTIKVDLTSHWLFRNAAVISYERVTKPNQTFSVTAGLQQIPTLVGSISDNIAVKRQLSASGIKVGGEYRFYLKKENRYPAPHGVYLGPYASFHNYSNNRSVEVDNNGTLEDAELKTDLNILNIGVQLGYQFVLNNRWAIDLVFIGPSVSHYRFNANLDGNFTFDPDEVTNEILQTLLEKYPGFKDFIQEGEFVSTGRLNTWAYGYRYQLQIGYHFGRKKK